MISLSTDIGGGDLQRANFNFKGMGYFNIMVCVVLV